jgi:hypothetical protein
MDRPLGWTKALLAFKIQFGGSDVQLVFTGDRIPE